MKWISRYTKICTENITALHIMYNMNCQELYTKCIYVAKQMYNNIWLAWCKNNIRTGHQARPKLYTHVLCSNLVLFSQCPIKQVLNILYLSKLYKISCISRTTKTNHREKWVLHKYHCSVVDSICSWPRSLVVIRLYTSNSSDTYRWRTQIHYLPHYNHIIVFQHTDHIIFYLDSWFTC